MAVVWTPGPDVLPDALVALVLPLARLLCSCPLGTCLHLPCCHSPYCRLRLWDCACDLWALLQGLPGGKDLRPPLPLGVGSSTILAWASPCHWL